MKRDSTRTKGQGGTRTRFGVYGGQYAPETPMPCLDELEEAYFAARNDADFHGELETLLRDYGGRVRYEKVADTDALDAFQDLSRLEGILPALEPSYAVASLKSLLGGGDESGGRHDGRLVVVCLSGRVDTPLVVMSCLNPLLNMRLEKFAEVTAGCGAQSVGDEPAISW